MCVFVCECVGVLCRHCLSLRYKTERQRKRAHKTETRKQWRQHRSASILGTLLAREPAEQFWRATETEGEWATERGWWTETEEAELLCLCYCGSLCVCVVVELLCWFCVLFCFCALRVPKCVCDECVWWVSVRVSTILILISLLASFRDSVLIFIILCNNMCGQLAAGERQQEREYGGEVGSEWARERDKEREREMAMPSQECNKSFTVLDLITHLWVLSSLPPPPRPPPSPSAAIAYAGSMTVYVTRQSLEAARGTPPAHSPSQLQSSELWGCQLAAYATNVTSLREESGKRVRERARQSAREREGERVRQVE